MHSSTIRMLAVVALWILAPRFSPAQITFQLDTIFSPTSGAIPPDNSAPWISAVFSDQGGGTVRLTLSVSGDLPATEFVRGWYFNFDDTKTVTSLNFAPVGPWPANVSVSAITKDKNQRKADGDGKYDFSIEFQNSGGAGRFTAGESVIYDLTYSAAITPADFNFLSFPAGGVGPFVTAAHVQGIPAPTLEDPNATTSVWITIPEPATYAGALCLLTGALGLVGRFRQRRTAFA